MSLTRRARSSARPGRALATALSALALGGCYSYRAAVGPPPGSEVRVELTTLGTSELARYLGPRITAVDGRVQSWGADSTMILAVSNVRAADGSRQPWAGEAPLTIAPSYVDSVRRRTLNRGRSWAVGAGTAAAIAAVGVAAVRASRGKNGDGGGTLPPPPP